jgi:2-succinyl-5-enolpyruvyl-6-hydroxy-3-cyclohexene-1-carboxylate synthase
MAGNGNQSGYIVIHPNATKILIMHTRQHIADLPEILRQKGVKYVIISPGSRNAPLINSFFRVFGDDCISIIDERSAAYIGLGIASYTQVPVVLLCTSGTAALNYAPAVAEAFHLAVPLLAITADRPPEWIDQQDNQTIRQPAIYSGNIKACFSLPVETGNEMEKWHIQRIINEAFNIAASGRKGPVHINVPLREPLYDELPPPGEIAIIGITESIAFNEPDDHFRKIWEKAKRILLVAGQQPYNSLLEESLKLITRDKRVCIIGEPVSNLNIPGTIRNPDPILMIREDNLDLSPDLLIYFGGQVISNRLKQFLRNCKTEQCWYIDPAGRHVDTFRRVTNIISAHPGYFFNWLALLGSTCAGDYYQRWQKRQKNVQTIYNRILNSVEFSDLGIIHRISSAIPENSVLFVGNSSIVRYIGFFPPCCKQIFSNRGTSGIDGCVSTATGIAFAAHETVFALVGDQSFVYDSNALWNRSLPKNLKIIVINNQGGGIFSLIKGPSTIPVFKPYLEAHHPVDIRKLSAAFGVTYYYSSNYKESENSFDEFIHCDCPAVFEVITPTEVNPIVFRNFISQFKKST